MVETFLDWRDSGKQSPSDRLSLLGQHEKEQPPLLPQAIDLAGSEPKPFAAENSLPKVEFTLHSERNPSLAADAIAAGTGFALGGTLTAAGEYALLRTAEPYMKILGALAFAPLSGHVAANFLYAPRLPWYTLMTPKSVLAGAAIGTALVVGGYETYKHFQSD